MQTRRWHRLAPWVVVGMLLLAFALRTYRLGARPLSFDEVASVFVAGRGPLGLLSYLQGAIREHPPLYYLLLSLWIPVVGQGEFAVRFLSVGIGLATLATTYRLAQKTIDRPTALLMVLLFVLSSFHVRESQNPRMYGLLALFSSLSIFFFVRLLHEDRARWWGAFWLATGLGTFTHYYMVFVLLAQDLFLLLSWRRYRRLWIRWTAVHLALAAVMAVWIVLSPGLWATIVSFWERGAASQMRWSGLARALNGLYLGSTVRPNWLHLGVPLLLTAFGIGVAQWLKPWLPVGHRNGGLLLGLLIGVPLVAVLALPERVTGRYLTVALPPCILALSLALSWLARGRPGWPTIGRIVRHGAWIALLLWVAFVSVYSYPLVYAVPKDTFRDRMAYVRAHARPDDGLLLHGPWQWLFLSYYDPGPMSCYVIPLDGLRVEAGMAGERLAQIFDEHECVWVSYDSVSPVDPDWVVARWLHEHTYQVWSEGNFVLYCAFADRELAPNQVGICFGERLQLERTAAAGFGLVGGQAVPVYTEWRALQAIDGSLLLRLELVDPNGEVWGVYESYVGPHHLPARNWAADETFVERRGLVVPVGTPPGDYMLRVRVFSDGVEWLPQGVGSFEIGTTLHVNHSRPSAEALAALPGQDVHATFGDGLALVGYEPGGTRFTQGYPLFFDVYWQALASLPEKYGVEIDMLAMDGAVLVEQRAPLVASLSTDRWLAGDVLLGRYAFSLPVDTPPGRYQVRLAVHAPDGSLLPVDGTRSYKILDLWPREQPLSGTEVMLFDVQVEARARRFRPPPMQHHLDAVFGDDMRLLGYDLADSSVDRGDAIQLTLYWQALRRMDRMYAMFNHLVGPDGEIVAQMDSWPQGGMYPTVQWLPGEVVEERYTIPVPPDTPPGGYELRVGLYDIGDGERPETFMDGVPVPERHIVLATIEVRE